MKNVELWPRSTDRKILAVTCIPGVVAFAALIGMWIPILGPAEDLQWVNGLAAGALLAFVWGVFRIVRPVRYRRKWVVAEFVAVPIIWVLLVIALALGFDHVHSGWYEIREFGDLW